MSYYGIGEGADIDEGQMGKIVTVIILGIFIIGVLSVLNAWMFIISSWDKIAIIVLLLLILKELKEIQKSQPKFVGC